MKTIFLDIETLPASEAKWAEMRPGVRADLAAKYKKEEKIQEKEVEAFRQTSLEGAFGRILCIGMIIEEGNRQTEHVLGWDEKRKRFTEDEPALLREFWELLARFDSSQDLLVGHNILDFDLKFLCQRSIVHGAKPSIELNLRHYSSKPIFDTMHEWARWTREMISLDDLALALGLQSSKTEEIAGDKVYDRYREGRFELIRNYCLADVRLTREIYRRLTFAG